ncbi:Gfo/Idh/MocA family oxidoreductase [Virgibacillus sp. 179-BFC.A HS]|uniref:Gfo/Idh/MocA family oxidoreductase n=1 Tax=Tigheibacillus jepli TaxID=3035914 RepID=A0ABU5CFC4_9BACI|nr:Gfo/Idh/MocA family oxidoreductase [Virgibacillus sp. 179-BFC.A HS]MDY0405033.1 Gfo/Idh/MocA family oxidoreductase [Virgibacillus sp. 179-BFC.A HS]
MRINRSDDYFANSTWKGTWKKDGGMLINQGIHLIDLFTWLMGNIKEVYGDITRNRKNKEIEDVAAGIVTFSNQAKGLIEANTITKPANLGYQLNIFAEKGTISIGGKGLQEIIHCYVEQHPELESELQSNATDEHLLMYKDFIEAIQKNRPPLVSAKESRKALETIFALYHSALKKQPVPLPLSAFSTEEMITWSKKGDEYND